MSDLFTKITAIATLEQGWTKVKGNQGGAGGDRMTLNQFEVNRDRRIATLHRALISGEYWPAPLRVVEIPKKSGGRRVLSIPSVIDRVAQSAASLILTPLLDAEFEDASFGYRPGRSVQMAVARVATLRRQGYGWTVDGDIEAYFDNVPHRRLLARLERSVDCAKTIDLVARWLEAYSETERGLPQGGPISPLLSNLYLDDIDEGLDGKGMRLVRFADDFLIMCNSELAAAQAHDKVARLLKEAGLRLNPEKTRITRFEEATRFLGHLFVRGMAMPSEYEEFLEPSEEPTPPAAAEPADADISDGPRDRLRWVYVTTPGRVLDHRNQSLVIRDGADGPELSAIPPGWADAIELGGDCPATDPALRLALSQGTPVYFLDGSGEMLGAACPPVSDRAELHLDQARHALDTDKCTAIAQILVAARLENQRAQLYRHNRSRKNDAIKTAAAEIGRLARLARIQPTVEKARGVEGRAAALYWPAFAACLREGASFNKRTRQPPTDPVNAVLGLLSGRLVRDVDVLIRRRGLHPGISYLHASQNGRPNLALDLMEIYRAPLVEAVTLALFNRQALSEGMFTRENKIWRMSSDGWRAMIGGYERAANGAVINPKNGHRTSWRGLIEEDILGLMRHLSEKDAFEPYRMDY